LRLAVPDAEITVVDAWQGSLRQNVAHSVGDFVLKRGDGVYAYQLAVVVDDAAMQISEVVRGADLLASAPRQVLLAQLLGSRPPGFAHLPLLVDEHGERLQKRGARGSIRDARGAGHSAAHVLAQLARWLGLVAGAPQAIDLAQLLACFDLSSLIGKTEVRCRVD
jgi:glutamyl-tRNA synthetase